jgi:SAM-dependent methyltransferase
MSNPLNFDDFAQVYDATINWPARLANEEPLLRKLIEQTNAQIILDAACGTGRHAQMLHSWGKTVHAADLSQSMLDIAVKRVPQSPTLSYHHRSFTQSLPPTYDFILCIGNSLSLPGSLDEAAQGVKSLIGALNPNGVLLVQVLNLSALEIGPSKWQRCSFVHLNDKNILAVKGLHRTGDHGHIDILLIDPEKGSLIQSRSAAFLGLSPQLLLSASSSIASSVEFFGDYSLSPYDPAKSPDIIMIARR